MEWGFNPQPKPVTKKPNRKKKKTEVYKGVAIPPRKKRAQIDKKNYEQAIKEYGAYCQQCGSPYIEMHHRMFRSQSGRKGWRNLIPLCHEHHRLCHSHYDYAEKWREDARRKFGPYFFTDKYDLWKEGLIQRPTDELFEQFMERWSK